MKKDFLTTTDIEKQIPHRFPMLLVDKIIDMKPGESAVGIKSVTNGEYFFPGHFPGHPVMPGVFIVEAMAQTAAAFTSYTEDLDPSGKIILLISVDEVKFRTQVVPGDQLHIHVFYDKVRHPTYKYKSKAYVDGKLAVEAKFMAMVADAK